MAVELVVVPDSASNIKRGSYRWIAALAPIFLGLSQLAAAQTVIDGDTLKHGGVIYRLWGIDAPEAKQLCPDEWPAGSLATTRLQALTAGRSIICQEKDRDRYGRIVAICRASGEDLGAIMVREGSAWGDGSELTLWSRR